MFVNRIPRFEPLSADALDTVDRGWKRLVSELGIKFLHEPSLELLAREGQRVEDEVAFLDPDWVLEKIRSTPTEFTLRARNPERDVRFGPDHMVFCAGQSMPFCDDGRTGRREGTLDDAVKLLRAAQVTADLCAREGMEHGLQKIEVFLKGPGSGRETAMRSLQAAGLEIIGVRDVSPQAHNGCRARKRRRV